MTNNFVGNAPQGSAPASMKAWRVHEFGSPEAKSLEAVPTPDPGPREVIVQVHAAEDARPFISGSASQGQTDLRRIQT